MISFKRIEIPKIDKLLKGKAKYIINGSEYFAEEAAIRHYEKAGYKALWSENTYWWAMMALLFWDVIFAKTRGAVSVIVDGVQTEVDPSDEGFEQLFDQTIELNGMPVDFFTPEFYQRREMLLKNRVQELQHTNLEQQLINSFKQNYGKNCRAIENWEKYKIDELLVSVQRLDKGKFIKILERLISNFSNNRSGLPDLIVYTDNEFFFSEVKSEKDIISDQQKEWHDFLSKTLGLKLEIVLINYSERQMQKLRLTYTPGSKEVIVSFGYSSSKKRDKAIEFVQEQESYFKQGEGKEEIHGAKFRISENDIENLFIILDLTSGWKTQRIEIDGEIINSTKLRNSLWCFREKTQKKASLDYCKIDEYDNRPNRFGCRNLNFPELETDEWQDYGYIDTAKGEWIFDHGRINRQLEELIDSVKYCPVFDVKKTRNLAKKIPEKINPKIDKQWAFISNDNETWLWHANSWLNTWGKTNFPGIGAMIGVQRIAGKDRNEAIRFSNRQETIKTAYSKSGKKEKKKSACFIATAVYGNKQARQVKTLRYFRDNYLNRTVLGALFIAAYYRWAPFMAKHIKRSRFLAFLVRWVLDRIVKRIERP